MQTLVVRPGIGYIAGIGERLLRDHHLPMSLGERVELTGLTVEVTALTADGRPAEAAFHFAVPLESSSLRWMQWRAGRFVPFTPPAVGETVVLRQPSPALWPFRREDAGVPPTTQP